MANERFIEVACEIVGINSPSEIRYQELAKLIVDQIADSDYDYVRVEHVYQDVFEDEFYEE